METPRLKGGRNSTAELELVPTNTIRVCAWIAYRRAPLRTGRREFKKAEEISPGSVNSLGALAYIYGLEGKKRQAEKMLPQVKALAVKAGIPGRLL